MLSLKSSRLVVRFYLRLLNLNFSWKALSGFKFPHGLVLQGLFVLITSGPLASAAAAAADNNFPRTHRKTTLANPEALSRPLPSIQKTINRLVQQAAQAPVSINVPSSVAATTPKHPLIQEEENLRNRLKAVPDSDLTSIYLNLINKAAQFLKTQGVDSEISPNATREGVELIIVPNDHSELNLYALEMEKLGFVVKYMGLDAVLKPNYTLRLLYPYIEQKEINIGSRALSDIPYFLRSFFTQATTLMLQKLKRGELSFIDNPSLARMGEGNTLFKGLDRLDPRNDILLDTKSHVIIAAATYPRTHLLDFYTHALALYLSSESILDRFQKKQRVSQGETVALRRSFHYLAVKVATRLQDLNAIVYTMLKHPTRIKFQNLSKQSYHMALDAYVHPDNDQFFLTLKFPWHHATPPTVPQLLQDPEFQALYRFNYALFAHLYMADAQISDHTVSVFVALQNIWDMLQEIPGLPDATKIKVYNLQDQLLASAAKANAHPARSQDRKKPAKIKDRNGQEEKKSNGLWSSNKWMHKIAYIQTSIRDLILRHHGSSDENAALRTDANGTIAPEGLRALENEYRHKIQQAIPEQRPSLFLEYLDKIRKYLDNRQIDAKIYDLWRGRFHDYWLKIMPTNRGPVNVFAKALHDRKITLQSVGIRDLIKDTMAQHQELGHANYAARRIYIGTKALENPTALLTDPVILRSLETFEKLQRNELPFLNNPLIIFQGKRYLPPPAHARFPYAQLVLDAQLPLNVFIGPYSKSSFNFMELYQKALNFYHAAQELKAKFMAQGESEDDEEIIKDLLGRYARVRLTAANAINEFNTILYYMINPATATQTSFEVHPDKQQLEITTVPDLAYPDFTYKLIIPWTAEAAPTIASVLADANFQGLYRYNFAIFQQLDQNFREMTNFRSRDLAGKLAALDGLAFLSSLPSTIIQDTQATPWSVKDYDEAVTQSQPMANLALENNLHHHRGINHAKNCGKNLVTHSKLKRTSLPAPPQP